MEQLNYDPRLVDVVSMAKATGINIFRIYRALGTQADPITDVIEEKRRSAQTIYEWVDGMQDMFDYRVEMGDKTHERAKIVVVEQLGIELSERLEDGLGITVEQFLALSLARRRQETGVPWGTEVQRNLIAEEMGRLDSVTESMSVYERIPVMVQEKDLAIRLIARFFLKVTSE